jgi:hypothetical protein
MSKTSADTLSTRAARASLGFLTLPRREREPELSHWVIIFSIDQNKDAMAAFFKNFVQEAAPFEIDDLWTKEKDVIDPRENCSMLHILAENLFDWPDAEDKIGALLADSDRLSKLVVQVADAALILGMLSQQLHPLLPNVTFVAPCLGCNTPYDAGGCSHESDRPKPQRLQLDGSMAVYTSIQHALHRTTTLLALTANLLSREDSYLLVQLLIPEPPRGMSTTDWVVAEAESGKKGLVCILQLFALIDNASTSFPKAVHYAAACLSLAVCRRPVRAFQLMDSDVLCGALHNYFEHLLDLLEDSQCLVEETFGIAAFINILPLLYWMGDWKRVQAPISSHHLPESIATILLNLVNSQNAGTDDDRIDAPWDLENMPELRAAIVFIEPLLLPNARATASSVLRDNPLSWTIAATFELLGKWTLCGIPVGTARLDAKVGRGRPLAACLQKYIPRLESLAPQARQIASPLATALAAQTPLPILHESSFLKNPLIRLARRCEFCGTTEARAANSTINMCAGGCRGLAQYCCKEHQKEHWPQHKGWCKMQQRG